MEEQYRDELLEVNCFSYGQMENTYGKEDLK